MPLSLRNFSQVLAEIKGSMYALDTPRFRLLDLPVELQDIIFRLCLATGNTHVLLLSKDIHTRAVRFLYRDAYLSLHSPDIDRDRKSQIRSVRWPLLPSNMSLIQNFSIHFDNDFLKELFDWHYITGIDFTLPPNAQARTFHIDFSREDEVLKDAGDLLGKLMTGLTIFDFVTVTAITKIKKRNDGLGEVYQPDARVFRARNRQVFNMFRREWEGTLGPAKFYDSPGQEGRSLEFRPREYLASVAAESN